MDINRIDSAELMADYNEKILFNEKDYRVLKLMAFYSFIDFELKHPNLYFLLIFLLFG